MALGAFSLLNLSSGWIFHLYLADGGVFDAGDLDLADPEPLLSPYTLITS